MNLIICVTNLQILIAERIIDLYPNEEFMCIVRPVSPQDKMSYYYERIKNKCTKSKIIYGDKGGDSKWKALYHTIRLLITSYSLPKIDKLFIASFDIVDLNILMTSCQNATIITFDDGTLNLNPEAFKSMLDKQGGGIYKLTHNILGTPYPYDYLSKKIKHYSIYQYPNVMGNTTFLNLFPTKKFASPLNCQINNTKKIFIGQPIFENEENGDSLNIRTTELAIEKFSVNLYYPHPRENYNITNVEYLDSPFVFEDYILQEIKRHPDTCFEVYSFCSSILLNLAGISLKQLKMVAIKPSNCPEYLITNYRVISDFGITIEELNINSERQKD